jgi:hypothetical protein
MPLLRSRSQMHRAKFRFVVWFFTVMAVVTLVFVAIVAIHYLLGWW